MPNADTPKKRASAIGLGLPWGRPASQIDNNDLEDAGERQAAAGLYALESAAVLPTEFSGGFSSRFSASSGLFAVVNSATAMKPVPVPVVKTTSWQDLVRFAEGPAEFGRRNRYVEYRFGGGSGPSRQFWGGK